MQIARERVDAVMARVIADPDGRVKAVIVPVAPARFLICHSRGPLAQAYPPMADPPRQAR